MNQIPFIWKAVLALHLGVSSLGLAAATPDQVFKSVWNFNSLSDHQQTGALLADGALNNILNQRTPLDSQTPEAFFGQVIEQIGRPENHFSASETIRSTPVTPTRFDEPPLIIVVPGIFGEFIAIHPFEESLRNSSPLQKEFEAKLQALDSNNENRTDPQLNMLRLAHEPRPLEELVRVGAVVDADGNVIANTLILHTQLMSMESIGVLRGNSLTFHRRISKFFSVLGRLPSRLAMIGYSRGAMNGLDLLSMAHKYKPAAWAEKIEAFISVGGVIYGSELADLAFSKKSAHPPIMTQRLQLLKRTARALQPISEADTEKTALFAANSRVWFSFLLDLAKMELGEALKEKSEDPKELLSLLRNKWSNVRKMLRAQADVNLKGLMLLASDIAFENFNLLKVVSEYNNNIRRFQLLTREAAVAAESLTTEARLAWWKENIIPTKNIRYYSVAASLVNPEAETASNTSSFSYNRRSPDYLSLLGSFLQFDRDLQIPFNDSQVGLHKAVFWPQLSPLLNPKQPPYTAFHLGVFQTHHWGLTLESVTPMRDASTEPFPRLNLLATLVQTVFNTAD